MKRFGYRLWPLLAWVCATAGAAPLPEADVPDPLKPWIAWSLQGQDSRACPLAHGSAEQRACVWPSALQLELDNDGGRFELDARLYAAGWLELPGSTEQWPQELRVDGGAAPVALRNGRPALWLNSGAHKIAGEFRWTQLPESLYVPAGAGLLKLAVNGAARPYPGRDDRGHVWLGTPASTGAARSRHLGLKVFRLLDDDLPARVTTRIDIEAAGEVRDEIIGPVLPAGFIPLQLGGNLPARLDDDGRLHVQVRPGVWNVEITARAPQRLGELAAPRNAAPWPDEEVWSFVAHNELRVVETGGAPAVDPRQTQIPEGWRGYPAFLLKAGAKLTLAEKQRGSPQPAADQLSLRRQLWLDFDGGGYTLQDELGGQLYGRWRLEATTPLTPGRVQIDGEPQLITRLGDAGPGVEVRHGQLRLVADSRIDTATRQLPVAGWNTDLQAVETTLHLPPGWRLFATSGTDNLPDTWIGRWSLLDLFVVLIASIAASRLFGLGWGLLTLLALALSWHEPGAPRWAWLNLIAAIALARALPDALKTGQLPAWLHRYRWLSAAVVVLIALPFAVQQARISLYPQLETHGGPAAYAAPSVAASGVEIAEDLEQQATKQLAAAPEEPMRRKLGAARERAYSDDAADSARVSQQSVLRMDPKVLTQTGPGLPEWSWRAATLNWSGPVTAEQHFRLWLSPPWLTRLLQVLGVLLIFTVLARWMDFKPPSPARGNGGNAAAGNGPGASPPLRGKKTGGEGPTPAVAALLVVALTLGLRPADAGAQAPMTVVEPAPPSAELLAELRKRLLAPPDCAPDCAQIPRLAIEVDTEAQLHLRLSIDALSASAVPLPLPLLASGAQGRIWQPAQVLLDGQPAALLRGGDGTLSLAVGAGRHEALIRGSLAGFDQLQLPLPLKPRRVTSSTRGWLLGGIGEQGQIGDALQLMRTQAAAGATSADAVADAQALPPLLIVSRTLHLGLDWDVDTEVRRVGVSHTPVLAAIALLKGEQITGEGVRVADGAVQLSLAPGQTEARWSSRLPIGSELQLQAPTGSDTVEIWQFDVGPLWHAEFEGFAPISHQSGDYWLPRYQPWPGESLKLRVSRPAGVAGQTLTLDAVELRTLPAQRATDYTLSLRLRASQGGQHPLALPADLSLQSLRIDGQPQPARQEGGKLILPLHPGTQNLQLELRADQGIGTRVQSLPLDLGLPGSNARLQITLPEDRWVLLLGGPQLGPAVLFWGVLAVLLVVAAALARLQLTPLKFWHWALLMIGLSQIPVWSAAVVAGWLIALGVRARYAPAVAESRQRFNFMQVALAALTLFALGLLFSAVAKGLLGAPDMQIAGNESYGNSLQWFQDRWTTTLPQAWVISVPLWVYRVLMLAWALWLANALLHWLRWGWSQFTCGGIWQKPEPKESAPKTPSSS